MERKKITKLLKELGYKPASVKAIMCGIRKPSYENILKLYQNHNIPFEAWIDIKSYLNNTTKKKSVKELQKVTSGDEV